MGNTNVCDNGEYWDYTSAFPNASVNAQSGPHPYLKYKDYSWLRIYTPTGIIVGLYPRKKFKKLFLFIL